VLERNVYTYES